MNQNRMAVKNIVLVHGGFVDGSGWEEVYKTLKRDGYTVAIVQNPTISLEDDVAATKRTIANQDGPVILVGHSYGGAVITEAGNDPKVAGRVYVAAFAPDKGESVSSLIKKSPPGAPVPPILPPQDGYRFLDKAKFPASFAADVQPEMAAFMADSQVPWGLDALSGTISKPAWKTKPSWCLLTTEDKMIPPDAQRAMSQRAGATLVEVKGSHAVYVSQPQNVATLIETAAKGAAAKAAKASAALHEGWTSSFLFLLRISGYSSATVGRRSFFFLLAEFFGCPRTNWPLDALLPRSSQYSTREFNTHLSMARRASRVPYSGVGRIQAVECHRPLSGSRHGRSP